MSHRPVDEKIKISTDPEKLNIEVVCNFLTCIYWAKGRTKQDVETSIKNSLCFGVYKDYKQIGFASILSDIEES